MLPEVEEEFERYLANVLPLRLIYVPEMRLIERDEVRTLMRNALDGITAEDIRAPLTTTTILIAEDSSPLDFYDGEVPRPEQAIQILVRTRVAYAVLSHVWFKTGEVTYSEMMNPSSQRPQTAGYEKLDHFCKEAASRYGVQLAWADTCCINKASSSELDESIRSMFKWYRNAYVCIAYLSGTTSISDVSQDHWFRRGWTLQELLVPQRIKFFGAGWRPLTSQPYDVILTDGSPEGEEAISLHAAIEKATVISAFDLETFIPGAYDLPKRFRWAAQRRTTRREDRAYSLMGLFDVSLPVAYGEGEQRAVFKLFEAITQQCAHPSIFCWAGKPSSRSDALPSALECYASSDDFSWIHPKATIDFALTNRGLRIKLIVIPGSLAVPSPDNLQDSNSFRCARPVSIDLPLEAGSVTWVCTWDHVALGIFTYFETPEAVYLAEQCAAFLLGKNDSVGSLELPSTWRKLETSKVLCFQPRPVRSAWQFRERPTKSGSTRLFPIPKTYLQTLWL